MRISRGPSGDPSTCLPLASHPRSQVRSDEEDRKTVKEIFDVYHPAYFIVGGDRGVRTASAFASASPPLLKLLGRTPHALIYQRLSP